MKKIFVTALILFSSSSFADNNAKNILKEINRNVCVTASNYDTTVIQCIDGNITIINKDKTDICTRSLGDINCRTIENK